MCRGSWQHNPEAEVSTCKRPCLTGVTRYCIQEEARRTLPNFTPLARPCLISDRIVELLSTFIFIISQLSRVGGLGCLDPGYARPSPFWHLPPDSLARPPASTLQPVPALFSSFSLFRWSCWQWWLLSVCTLTFTHTHFCDV